ncbi:MAG: glycosyltransferase family 32 protein [Chlamydiales bacterium]
MSKKRKVLILLCVVVVSLSTAALFFGGAKRKAAPSVTASSNFESLMGQGTAKWQYVQTKQDFENLAFFKTLYESKKLLLEQKNTNPKIPHLLHFIWLGPKPFPRESVENVRSWMGKNPDWRVKFWSDRERPLPSPGMELHLIQDFQFLALQECYNKSDSYGEKSDLLRYEILFQEGGVYADHDVKCFRSFADLNNAYDFYSGMDMPFKSSLPSCILPTNNLIGASPHHPILKTCIDALKTKWDQIGSEYPGSARDEMLNRVLHRTFLLFGEAVMKANNLDGRQDIIFPAYYFDAPTENEALWAYHFYSGKWFEEESKFEKMVRERLMTITKKTNKLFLIVGVMSGLNLIGLCVLLFLFRKRKQNVTS